LKAVLSFIALWSVPVAVTIGGVALVRSDLKRKQQERIDVANTAVRDAVKGADDWIMHGRAKDGEEAEQRLITAMAAKDASEKANADAALERVRTRRAQLAADSILVSAKFQLDAKAIVEAVALLRRYVAEPHATKKPEAEQLLVDCDLATSESAAVNSLLAMSDEQFARFKNTGKLDDRKVTHPILAEVRAATLRRNLEKASHRREENRIAEAKRQESDRLALAEQAAMIRKKAEQAALIRERVVGIWQWGPDDSKHEMKFAKDGTFVEKSLSGWTVDGQWRVAEDGTIRLSVGPKYSPIVRYSAVIRMSLLDERFSVALTYPAGFPTDGSRQAAASGGWQAEGRKVPGTWDIWHDEEETERFVQQQIQNLQQREDPALRCLAADNLAEVGRIKPRAVSVAFALLREVVLNDPDEVLRPKAVEALAETRQFAAIRPILQTLRQSRDPVLTQVAEDALLKLLPTVKSLTTDQAIELSWARRWSSKRVWSAIESTCLAAGYTQEAIGIAYERKVAVDNAAAARRRSDRQFKADLIRKEMLEEVAARNAPRRAELQRLDEERRREQKKSQDLINGRPYTEPK